MRALLLIAFLLTVGRLNAAKIDTVDTYSPSMKKTIKAVVITPESNTTGSELPVVYLLHGYSGNYADWAKKAPALAQTVDANGVMVVCPDGNFGSWYYDSPVDPAFR